MISWKNVITSFAKSLIYSLIIIFLDIVLFFFFSGGIDSQFNSSLSFILLLEGGMGLITGGAMALYSPSLSKMSEVIFHHKPWSYKRQKQIEKQVEPLLITGLILIIEALLISAI